MGACTFARASGSLKDQAEGVLGTKRVVRGVVTFSSSYANPAGDTLPHLSQNGIGLAQIDKVLIDPDLAAAGVDVGLTVRLGGTPGARTLRAFDAANTEVGNGTNLSARAVPVWFIGYG